MPRHATLGKTGAEVKHLPPLQVTWVTVWGEWFPNTIAPQVAEYLKAHDVEAQALGNTVKVHWSARDDNVGIAKEIISEWRFQNGY